MALSTRPRTQTTHNQSRIWRDRQSAVVRANRKHDEPSAEAMAGKLVEPPVETLNVEVPMNRA